MNNTKLIDESAQEMWGCWDGLCEVVSVMEPTKDGAIEEYANDYLHNQLESETETTEFPATISLGRKVRAEDYAPDLEDLIEHIEQSGADNDSLDEELIVMTEEQLKTAAKAYERLINQFCRDYLIARDWYIFDLPESIAIKFVNGEYAGWEPVK